MAKNSPVLINIGQGMSIMAGLPTISFWDELQRPKNPKPGTIGFNTSTRSLEYWNGTNWFSAQLV
jgi:hypothetical protein